MSTPSRRLKRWRTIEKLSVTQAASAVDVSRMTWHRWEFRDRQISLAVLPRVAYVTGIKARLLRPDIVHMMRQQQ